MSGSSGFFGRDPDSYNLDGDADDFYVTELSDRSGRPGINVAARAISFWLGQNGDSTIGKIAEAFKMPPAAVAEACEHEPWLYIGVDDGPMSDWLVGQDGA